MRRTAGVLAALVVLTGCGVQTTATSAQGPSTSAAPTPSGDTDQPSGGSSDKDSGEAPEKAPDKADGQPRESSASPTVPPDAPACSAVWVDGTTLARNYEGCRTGQRFVGPDEEFCSFGQRLVRFSDHFYAVRGGPVNRTAAPLGKDRVYRGALASCRG